MPSAILDAASWDGLGQHRPKIFDAKRDGAAKIRLVSVWRDVDESR